MIDNTYYTSFLELLNAYGLGHTFSIEGFSKEYLEYVEKAESEGYIKTLATNEPGKKDKAIVVRLYYVTDEMLEEYF